MEPLEKFGNFIMTRFRDPAIDHIDGLLVGHWKGPMYQALHSQLARLTPEQRELVRRVVISSIDVGLHDFLFAIGEAHDFKEGIAVVVDGQDIVTLSDGLQGELFLEDGWFARFSKHGPNPDTA